MKYICTTCGYNELNTPPWGEDGSTPNFEICPCCGVEFGYEDSTEKGKERFLAYWIDNGMNWFVPKLKPCDWSLNEQLKNLCALNMKKMKYEELIKEYKDK